MSFFSKVVEITGNTPTRLSTLLTANGYTGGMIGTQFGVTPSGASVYIGSASNVDNTTGFEVMDGENYSLEASGYMGNVIDPGSIYLYRAATGNVSLTFAGF